MGSATSLTVACSLLNTQTLSLTVSSAQQWVPVTASRESLTLSPYAVDHRQTSSLVHHETVLINHAYVYLSADKVQELYEATVKENVSSHVRSVRFFFQNLISKKKKKEVDLMCCFFFRLLELSIDKLWAYRPNLPRSVAQLRSSRSGMQRPGLIGTAGNPT
jgi:hypothetical protein